ncbi:FkbM family methyltransferase [Mycolicibacterium komossense]|uniref:FkbM family methyltransferase n=1 Tax=Mycolicibacterium komossense TaxID=1779 RepID=A0ABT3CDH9_9MYCO|nr:FkbM family methyltransferase [Mycolicibacterium komossense]MCV7227511.1 FkbM family methyltransferase [Mycolicibacterium komossense]
MELKKAVRTAQTYAAPLVDIKAWGQRELRRIRHSPSDSCYRAFEKLPVATGRQFLDIGANRGQTIDSFRLYQKATPILAFEPSAVLVRRLVKQYSEDPAVTIHPFGLGHENGHFDLFVPFYRGFMFDGLASFDYDSAHDWLNSEHIYGFKERHLKIEKIRCEVRIWDEVETSPDLVKIDVQGYEASVLRGGLQTIRNHRPTFLLENNSEFLHEDILFAEGYRRASYTNSRMILGELGAKNTFYFPEEKAEDIRASFS